MLYYDIIFTGLKEFFMKRTIINKESFSAGKKEGHNDDAIYIGTNFAAVIDGVSHKSEIVVEGKSIKIAEIITNALRKIDSPDSPAYAKTLTFEEIVIFINMYISDYLQKYGLQDQIGELEATGVIYSKHHNQLWLVGDCKAMYDGITVENRLKIDEVYSDIRKTLIKALLQEGYTQEELLEHDYSKDIIKNPELLSMYIKSDDVRDKIEEYWHKAIKTALRGCGFSEEEIEDKDLVKKFLNPRELQKDLKNNAKRKDFGYAIFNGKYTEIQNCKVVDLPDDVKTIKLCSDGFRIEELVGDIAQAVRKRRKTTEKDLLSIAENQGTHASVKYSQKEGRIPSFAIDDASAIIIEIKHTKELPESREEYYR